MDKNMDRSRLFPVLQFHPDYTTQEIAEQANLSLGTAKLLVREAIEAYGTRTRAGAVLEAVLRGDLTQEQIIR